MSSHEAAPLIDHALIVGAPPTLELASTAPAASIFDCSYVPEVLLEYPASRPLDAKVAVAAFCLPSGLRLARVRRQSEFACFVLTLADGSRLYGHCLMLYEPLDSATVVARPPREVPTHPHIPRQHSRQCPYRCNIYPCAEASS